jgi:hypothetical protein
MLSMFMNRKDVDAACDAMSQQTVQNYYNAAAIHHERRMRAIKESDAVAAFNDVIDEKDEMIQSLYADRNALLTVVKQLVDMNDPAKWDAIYSLKSRAMDAEFDRMIKAGVLKYDPRTDPAWREDFGYLPR